MTGEVFGIWHNGWCGFITSRNPDRIGYGYSGSYQEAEMGRLQFLSEGAEPSTYEVVPFDNSREPAAIEIRKPSACQLKMLQYVDKIGSTNRFPILPNWNRTSHSLWKYGWVTVNLTINGQEQVGRQLRLTVAGRSALELANGKKL